MIESVDLEPDGRGGEQLVARVRPKGGVASQCSRCQRRCPGYDVSTQPRRWRGLDMGTTPVFLQTLTRRVLLHIAWRSVSGIVTRVVAERAGAVDRLAGLRRIGIDEISYRKGQRYLLVVTCHDTGRLVWAGKDRTKETLGRFFDDLGAERAMLLTHVSADGAEFIHTVVAARAPRALLCLDPFHVVAWATKALDEVRRRLAAERDADRRRRVRGEPGRGFRR